MGGWPPWLSPRSSDDGAFAGVSLIDARKKYKNEIERKDTNRIVAERAYANIIEIQGNNWKIVQAIMLQIIPL
jgi:hypothetical protein